jgi:hypothetical protein
LIKKLGIANKTAWQFRKVAENPDAVDLAFKNASDQNDVPGVSAVMGILGYNHGAGKRSKMPTADQTAKNITNQLLEINMVLARLVEHLDQVKSENARALHEALQRTVEIWTAKAP